MSGVGKGKGRHARGSEHYRWAPRIVSSHGYVKIRVGISHPLADRNGYAYEHLVVWCSAGRPRPKRGELLHHKSEDREDNRIENLELKTRSRHNSDHLKQRERDARGRLVPITRARS